ncbi:MAG: hypothetical protein ACXW27_07230 [Allosphingosinicella sp.]
MRLAVFALALALPAASSALPVPPRATASAPHRLADSAVPSRFCRDDLKVRPIRSPEGAKARRLGELPPGDLTLTVLNRVGDCIEPVTVRQGYGALDSRPGR